MPNRITPEILKVAIKEAIEAWADKKYQQIGRWTVRCLCVSCFCVFLKAVFYFHLVDLKQLIEVATSIPVTTEATK